MKYPPVTIEGESLTQAKWAAKLGVTRGAIHFRQKKYGETPEQAVLHFYNKKRMRNIEKYHTAAEAEAAFDKFCLKSRTGRCRPWACPLPRDTGASSCLVAWLFSTVEGSTK